jgi:hypothetical protein
MSETPVVLSESAMMLAINAVKVMALTTVSTFGAVYAGVTAVVSGPEGNTIAIGTTLGVSVTFAGLILRMVIKNQGAIWDIVRSKDKEIAKKDVEIRQLKLDKEYAQWQTEQARFRAKEVPDPGPFKPSPGLMVPQKMDTTSSVVS